MHNHKGPYKEFSYAHAVIGECQNCMQLTLYIIMGNTNRAKIKGIFQFCTVQSMNVS